jgi:hypothetical protein
VAIGAGPTDVIGSPQPLFEDTYAVGAPGGHNYDVTPDGERFLMIKSVDDESTWRLHVVLHWMEELKQRVPAR